MLAILIFMLVSLKVLKKADEFPALESRLRKNPGASTPEAASAEPTGSTGSKGSTGSTGSTAAAAASSSSLPSAPVTAGLTESPGTASASSSALAASGGSAGVASSKSKPPKKEKINMHVAAAVALADEENAIKGAIILALSQPLREMHSQNVIRLSAGPASSAKLYSEWAHGKWTLHINEILNPPKSSWVEAGLGDCIRYDADLECGPDDIHAMGSASALPCAGAKCQNLKVE